MVGAGNSAVAPGSGCAARGGYIWPRSTRTGTAPGHWTGNATTTTSRRTSPAATCPTSPPASSWTATTSDAGSNGAGTGDCCRASSRSGCRSWACSPPTAASHPDGQGRDEGAVQGAAGVPVCLAALAQWIEREGAHRPVPRGKSEQITVDGEAEPAVVKLGVWVSNTRCRRDKLTSEQLQALRELGSGEWA
ncbi:helicase associated domain-containing protein [Streptomyces flaveolus]|uniref:helicase associated domain-containing protein n=1 Tax=Streptomyces flaveolus TaxID=67297 RepID=UPI003809775F